MRYYRRQIREADEILAGRIPEISVDNSAPRPDPAPEGLATAGGKVGKPDTSKDLAEQYRVDPNTGSFFEEPDIEQLRLEGRLTEQDVADLAEAQAVYDDGVAFGEAMKAAVNCLI